MILSFKTPTNKRKSEEIHKERDSLRIDKLNAANKYNRATNIPIQ